MDPSPGRPSHPATLHAYTYVLANPLRAVDPSGWGPEPQPGWVADDPRSPEEQWIYESYRADTAPGMYFGGAGVTYAEYKEALGAGYDYASALVDREGHYFYEDWALRMGQKLGLGFSENDAEVYGKILEFRSGGDVQYILIAQDIRREALESAVGLLLALDLMPTGECVSCSRRSSGARDISVAEYKRREREAERAYERIRQDTTDVEDIAENTGLPQYRVQRVKEHVFQSEHLTEDGVKRFDPDYEMAQAWDRLRQGTQVEADMQLLEHEYAEAKYEGIYGVPYEAAHDAIHDNYPWCPPGQEE